MNSYYNNQVNCDQFLSNSQATVTMNYNSQVQENLHWISKKMSYIFTAGLVGPPQKNNLTTETQMVQSTVCLSAPQVVLASYLMRLKHLLACFLRFIYMSI